MAGVNRALHLEPGRGNSECYGDFATVRVARLESSAHEGLAPISEHPDRVRHSDRMPSQGPGRISGVC
jgi:hypothetical protein